MKAKLGTILGLSLIVAALCLMGCEGAKAPEHGTAKAPAAHEAPGHETAEHAAPAEHGEHAAPAEHGEHAEEHGEHAGHEEHGEHKEEPGGH